MIRAACVAALGLLAGAYYAATLPTFCPNCAAATAALMATAPFHYRVLVGVFLPLSAPAYIAAHVIVLPVMLLALYVWLRVSVSPNWSLFGVALVALYLPVMFEVWGFALYSALEVVFLCAGLLLLTYRPAWIAPFAALTAVATLNRETTVLLPLVAFALRPRDWRLWLPSAVAWGVMFVGLRLALGPVPNSLSIAQTWQRNTSGWWLGEAQWKLPLFAPVLAAVVFGYHAVSLRTRRIALVAVPYMALFAVFGTWHEVRLLLPALTLALPVALVWLSRLSRSYRTDVYLNYQ